MPKKRRTLFHYLIVVTRDILEDQAVPYYYQLALALTTREARVSFFFVREGVRSFKQNECTPQLRFFSRANVDLWVDPHSLTRRGISSRQLMSSAKVVALSTAKLSANTFVLVDPIVPDNYVLRRTLHLAEDLALCVDVLTDEQVYSVIVTHRLAGKQKRFHQEDWLILLLDKSKQEKITLIWTGLKFGDKDSNLDRQIQRLSSCH